MVLPCPNYGSTCVNCLFFFPHHMSFQSYHTTLLSRHIWTWMLKNQEVHLKFQIPIPLNWNLSSNHHNEPTDVSIKKIGVERKLNGIYEIKTKTWRKLWRRKLFQQGKKERRQMWKVWVISKEASALRENDRRWWVEKMHVVKTIVNRFSLTIKLAVLPYAFKSEKNIPLIGQTSVSIKY